MLEAFKLRLILLGLVLLSAWPEKIRAQRHYDVRIWTQPTAVRSEGIVAWTSKPREKYDQRSQQAPPFQNTRKDPQCSRLGSTELMRRARSSGFYDSAYMAPDVETAAANFPDFHDKHYMRAKETYTCDNDCMKHSQVVRTEMRKGRTYMKRYYTYAPAQPEVVEVVNHPNYYGQWPTSYQANNGVSWAQLGGRRYRQHSHGRKKRASRRRRTKKNSDALVRKNTGQAKGIIGTTIAIECDIVDDSVPAHLVKFCGACRAIRQLPKQYYPRVLNEVICGEEKCIGGDGQCVQRFLPFKVLRNFGDDNCDDWRAVSIELRTCCDCMLDRSSVFLDYVRP